jgi:hypothetical protein
METDNIWDFNQFIAATWADKGFHACENYAVQARFTIDVPLLRASPERLSAFVAPDYHLSPF